MWIPRRTFVKEPGHVATEGGNPAATNKSAWKRCVQSRRFVFERRGHLCLLLLVAMAVRVFSRIFLQQNYWPSYHKYLPALFWWRRQAIQICCSFFNCRRHKRQEGNCQQGEHWEVGKRSRPFYMWIVSERMGKIGWNWTENAWCQQYIVVWVSQ